MFEVKVPTIFFATEGFSLRREGRYSGLALILTSQAAACLPRLLKSIFQDFDFSSTSRRQPGHNFSIETTRFARW
jgi:hypothetical protein